MPWLLAKPLQRLPCAPQQAIMKGYKIMPTYNVTLSRTAWSSALVKVEADTPEKAEAQALLMADNEEIILNWETEEIFDGPELLEILEI